MSAVQGYLAERLDLVEPEQRWFRGCHSRPEGDFLGTAGTRAARAVCGRWNRSSIPDFPGRGDGVHSLCSELGSVKVLLSCLSPAVGVFMLLLAFTVCFSPLPSFCCFIVLTPNQNNSFIFIFPPDFSAEKHPFCCLAGKQKLGLCRALEQLQRRKMVMVASSKSPLLAPPPLNSASFHQHVFLMLQADE